MEPIGDAELRKTESYWARMNILCLVTTGIILRIPEIQVLEMSVLTDYRKNSVVIEMKYENFYRRCTEYNFMLKDAEHFGVYSENRMKMHRMSWGAAENDVRRFRVCAVQTPSGRNVPGRQQQK